MDGPRIDRRAFIAAWSSLGLGALGLAGPGRADGPATAPPGIRVGPIRRVGAEGVKYIEPWLCASPRDAKNLIVAASVYVGPGSRGRVRTTGEVRYTADGGETWSVGDLPGMAEFRDKPAMFLDTYATFAADGTAFVEFLGGSGDHPGPDLWTYRSDDGGRRWHGPTVIGGPFDFPRLAADLHEGKPRLFIVVSASGGLPIFHPSRPGGGCAILRSDDGGRTFSAVNLLAPTTLSHQPNNSPIILPDGRLLVTFQDFVPVRNDPQLTLSRFYTAQSNDGAATFSLPAPMFESSLMHSDVGVAADLTDGPRRGRVFSVSHSDISDPPGLRLRTSEDGAKWTQPTAVPTARDGPIPHVAVAVSAKGVLGVAWVHGEAGSEERMKQRVNNTGVGIREDSWNLFFTASADGGKSFAAPVPLLKEPYRTDEKVTPRWPYGTDYISLAAPPDSSFHLLWVDSRDGRGVIQTAKIEAGADP
jgi:hypothetical protein